MENDYKYNAICDSCGWKRKSTEMRQRWDGLMVCADTCWEARHPMDFYRTRNDTHKLPWIRRDDNGEATWTPTINNVTGSYTVAVATYIVDANNVVNYRIELKPTTGSVVGALATISLPIGTVSVDKKGTAITSLGRRLGQVTAAATLSIPNFTINASPLESLLISGSYTKV